MPVITNELLRQLPRRACDISDARQPGFVVRCRPSGAHSYLVRAGRGKWYTLGRVGTLGLADAREEARKVLSNLALGLTPRQAPSARRVPSLKSYVADTYAPWVMQHRKTGEEIVTRIRSAFPTFQGLPIDQLSTFRLEQWRAGRLREGTARATINRDISDLRAALVHAVRWKVIPAHPFADLRPLKLDSRPRVRYLTAPEEARLVAALKNRDDVRRRERQNANQWRRTRGYVTYSDLGTYTDHLQPMVLLALHTGLRRGELFGLEWSDVDLGSRQLLTVRGEGAKSGHTRYVDLNAVAVEVLETWQRDSQAALTPEGQASPLVFPSADGQRLDNVQSAWEGVLKAAEVTGFRFHDLRHTFASRLVQAAVDLNTVRELLGHADLKMTLRYAHLSPDNRRAAVDRLVRPDVDSPPPIAEAV